MPWIRIESHKKSIISGAGCQALLCKPYDPIIALVPGGPRPPVRPARHAPAPPGGLRAAPQPAADGGCRVAGARPDRDGPHRGADRHRQVAGLPRPGAPQRPDGGRGHGEQVAAAPALHQGRAVGRAGHRAAGRRGGREGPEQLRLQLEVGPRAPGAEPARLSRPRRRPGGGRARVAGRHRHRRRRRAAGAAGPGPAPARRELRGRLPAPGLRVRPGRLLGEPDARPRRGGGRADHQPPPLAQRAPPRVDGRADPAAGAGVRHRRGPPPGRHRDGGARGRADRPRDRRAPGAQGLPGPRRRRRARDAQVREPAGLRRDRPAPRRRRAAGGRVPAHRRAAPAARGGPALEGGRAEARRPQPPRRARDAGGPRLAGRGAGRGGGGGRRRRRPRCRGGARARGRRVRLAGGGRRGGRRLGGRGGRPRRGPDVRAGDQQLERPRRQVPGRGDRSARWRGRALRRAGLRAAARAPGAPRGADRPGPAAGGAPLRCPAADGDLHQRHAGGRRRLRALQGALRPGGGAGRARGAGGVRLPEPGAALPAGAAGLPLGRARGLLHGGGRRDRAPAGGQPRAGAVPVHELGRPAAGARPRRSHRRAAVAAAGPGRRAARCPPGVVPRHAAQRPHGHALVLGGRRHPRRRPQPRRARQAAVPVAQRPDPPGPDGGHRRGRRRQLRRVHAAADDADAQAGLRPADPPCHGPRRGRHPRRPADAQGLRPPDRARPAAGAPDARLRRRPPVLPRGAGRRGGLRPQRPGMDRWGGWGRRGGPGRRRGWRRGHGRIARTHGDRRDGGCHPFRPVGLPAVPAARRPGRRGRRRRGRTGGRHRRRRGAGRRARVGRPAGAGHARRAAAGGLLRRGALRPGHRGGARRRGEGALPRAVAKAWSAAREGWAGVAVRPVTAG